MLHAGELDLPLPGAGQTARRWAALADWGGRDLSLARLAEGHVDALAILAEAGRPPVPGALYGVWASRSGGAAVRLEQGRTSRVLTGEMRFCSGVRVLDRVLLVADPAADSSSIERLLVDVDVRMAGVEPEPELVHRRDGGRAASPTARWPGVRTRHRGDGPGRSRRRR
jgi:hypothetical protein